MIGIIGGTGVYDINMLTDVEEKVIDTPFGKPSGAVIVGNLGNKKVAFLPRHGKGHSLAPHQLNYRANIWALKSLGVKIILAPCAVGSLKQEIVAGDFVFVDQFIDRTHGRESTFYDKNNEKVCHISMADPCCESVRKILIESAEKLGLGYHANGVYVCINGPRFSTCAESKLFQSWGGDVIGMTMVPESVLAREAEICYVSIAMVTDYDCWKDKPVSMGDIIKTVGENSEKSKKLLAEIIDKIDVDRDCGCQHALKDAFA